MGDQCSTAGCLLVGMLLVLAGEFTPSAAQFPTACMMNATQPNATCCPIPDGARRACGGFLRGRCTHVSNIVPVFTDWNTTMNEQISKLPFPIVSRDDRISWPSRFFSYVCSCSFNYAGAACERCASGWTGFKCLTRTPVRVRRNVMNMTVEEQHLLRDVILASKVTPSNWSVLSVDDGESADPTTSAKMEAYPVSVYDLMVYQHFYATRSTMLHDEMTVCTPELENLLNFAYRGPAFLPWHRYHLLQFEESLARIAEEQFNVSNFALAYWDWTEKSHCEICTNDLIGGFKNTRTNATSGGSNEVDPEAEVQQFHDNKTTIDPRSPFSKWHPLCSDRATEPLPTACHTCDIETDSPEHLKGAPRSEDVEDRLTRSYNPDPRFQRLPLQEDVDTTMAADQLDTFPFNEFSDNSSFRNCLEGFAALGPDSQGPYNMNNLVRKFIIGTWSNPSTSPNDPLYLFHFAYVDKLFNLFIRSKNQTDRKFPFNNTKYGHSGFQAIVPSFPPVRLNSYTLDSTLFGYDYDDDLAGATVVPPARPTITADPPAVEVQLNGNQQQHQQPSRYFSGLGIGLLAAVGLVGATLMVVAVYRFRRHSVRSRSFQYVPVEGEVTQLEGSLPMITRVKKGPEAKKRRRALSEKTPLLTSVH